MKHLSAFALIVFSSLGVSAQTSGVAYRIRGGTAAPPATCRSNAPADTYYRTSNNTLYICVAGVYRILAVGSVLGPGDVVGPASATDNAVARYNLTTGKLLQNSLVTISDTGTVNIPTGQAYNINGVPVGTNPAGSNTQFQFNNSSAFGGAAGLTYDTVLGMPRASAIIIPETTVTGTPSADTAWLSFDNTTQKLACTDDAGGDCMPANGVGGSTGVVDNAALRADGIGGTTLQNSPLTIADTTGYLDGPAQSDLFSGGVSGANTYFRANGGVLAIGPVSNNSMLFEFAAQNKVVMMNTALFGWSSTGVDTATNLRAGLDTTLYRSAAGQIGAGTTSGNGAGTYLAAGYFTTTNCADSAGAAACGAAAAGHVVIDAGATSVVITTTAVTANSQITPTFDASVGTRLGVTCNVTAALPYISARTAGTSFTITTAVSPITNPACYGFTIVN